MLAQAIDFRKCIIKRFSNPRVFLGKSLNINTLGIVVVKKLIIIKIVYIEYYIVITTYVVYFYFYCGVSIKMFTILFLLFGVGLFII